MERSLAVSESLYICILYQTDPKVGDRYVWTRLNRLSRAYVGGNSGGGEKRRRGAWRQQRAKALTFTTLDTHKAHAMTEPIGTLIHPVLVGH